MSKLLKRINLDTSSLQRIEEYFLKSAIGLNEFIAKELREKFQKDLQKTNFEIHDKITKLRNKIKHVNLGNSKLTIGVVGGFSTGKSSFINSLLGEELLGTDLKPTTAKITKLIYGEKLRILKVLKNEELEQITREEYNQFSIHEQKKEAVTIEADLAKKEIQYFKIEYPNSFLEKFNIIDTPGFSSTTTKDDELTKSWISKLDILIWLFDVNKAGDKDEINLLKELGNGLKVFGILNMMDLKPNSAGKKVQDHLMSQYKFEEIFLYSSKKVLATNSKRKLLREELNKLFSEITKYNLDEKKEVKISFSKSQIALDESIYDFKIKDLDYLKDYNSLKIKFYKIREEQRTLFENIYQNEYNKILKENGKSLEEFIEYQEKILIEFKEEIERLDKSFEDLNEQLLKSQTNIFEYHFGSSFYNNLFSYFFGYKSEDGWFSNSTKLKIHRKKVVEIEEYLKNKFNIYFEKTIECYIDVLINANLKHLSHIIDEGSNSKINLKDLCYSILSQTARTFSTFVDQQFEFEIENRENIKEILKSELFYSSPIEFLFEIIMNFVLDDFYLTYNNNHHYFIRAIEEFEINIESGNKILKTISHE